MQTNHPSLGPAPHSRTRTRIHTPAHSCMCLNRQRVHGTCMHKQECISKNASCMLPKHSCTCLCPYRGVCCYEPFSVQTCTQTLTQTDTDTDTCPYTRPNTVLSQIQTPSYHKWHPHTLFLHFLRKIFRNRISHSRAYTPRRKQLLT
jgi:hypothetical protein